MVLNLFAPVLFAILTASTSVHADVLFEGYGKVSIGDVHVGYTISRYEFNPKTKRFLSTTFLKTNDSGGGITESLKAEASEDLQPISYSYTTLVSGQAKTIDAKFEKNRIQAVIRQNGKEEKISKEIPKGSFLSTFLTYVILRSPQGLKPETKFDYQAIAEEDAALVKGTTEIKAKEEALGQQAFRIMNDFKGSKFVVHVNEKGEALITRSPAQGILVELVADPSLATQNMQVPAGLLKTLFGSTPKGLVNSVAQAKPAAKTTPVAPAVAPPGK